MIKKEGLKGAMIYFDGQFDDARTDLSVVLTAIQKGVVALNRFKVIDLTHDSQNGAVTGAIAKDQITGKFYTIKAKSVINAAGHFADEIRLMDDPKASKVLQASAGVHIVLDGKYCPSNEGLLISKTRDNRVVFLLPWQGKTLAGTTDSPSEITNNPKPSEKDIEYILEHINMYFDVQVKRSDVLSAWAGIRPLKKATEAKDTASISREHAIYTSPSGLATIIGGKWTTYRSMSSEIMDKVISQSPALQQKCIAEPTTDRIKMVGGEEYNPQFASRLGLEKTIADHVNRAYGDQSYIVAEIASRENLSERLHPNYPYIQAEVIYSIRYEYALSIVDILERRTRLSMIDRQAAISLIQKVSSIMALELKWSKEVQEKEEEEALNHLQM